MIVSRAVIGIALGPIPSELTERGERSHCSVAGWLVTVPLSLAMTTE